MSDAPIDDVDRAILYQLQVDARQPITELAEYADVSDNTVRNRMEKLEERGIVQGYSADVDYHRIGAQHYYQFVCTARVSEREALVERAHEVPGVVEVRALMTGNRNVLVTAVGGGIDEITGIASRLDEMGLVIEQETLIRSSVRRPLDRFER